MPIPFGLINALSRNLFYENSGPITVAVTLMKIKTINVIKVNTVNSILGDPTVSRSGGPGRVGSGGDGLGWRGKGSQLPVVLLLHPQTETRNAVTCPGSCSSLAAKPGHPIPTFPVST